MSREAFENAARNARPDCPKCKGTGEYQYTTRGTPHSTICDLCCKHNMGWWKLEHHYGENNGKWCCKAGCGKTIKNCPELNGPCSVCDDVCLSSPMER